MSLLREIEMTSNTPRVFQSSAQDALSSTSQTLNRRRFFATGASGLGTLALASLLNEDGALAADVPPQLTHFAPKAKRCMSTSLWKVDQAKWICSIRSRN